MREVALDITRLVGRALQGRVPTGIDRVGLAYVEHMRSHAQAVLRVRSRRVLVTPTASQRIFERLLDGSFATPRGRVRLLEATSRIVPELGVPEGAVLLHTGHGGLEKHKYLQRWRRSGGVVVAFVHDLIPLTHPEYARAGEAIKHDARMRALLGESAAVIANSAVTVGELRRFADRAGLVVPRTVVAHLGAAPLPAPSPVRPLAEPYFVVVGTIEARKNHLMLLKVWRRLVETQGNAAPKLVILGQRGWECENVFDMLERCESLRGVVIEKPGVSDAELATYVHHAQASLFPSFVEGYGLPLMEGLAAGVPVVASDLPVFRELAGEAPIYVDPLDGPGWLARVTELAGAEARTRAAQRIQGFHAPSWKDHFEKVDALMESLP
jgi:glycosyltransferase involved in cell wall biosynthesis